MRAGMIPVAPIRALIERWSDRTTDYAKLVKGDLFLGNLSIAAELTGIKFESIRAIMSGQTDSVGFDKADRIVCHLSKYGAYGWHVEPGLKEIYEEVDLSLLDRKQPCTVAA